MEVDALPLHFIFHTAFCRSTLLARALNIPGISMGMSEPGIIASLASGGPGVEPLIKPLLRLLGRKKAGIDAIFVKSTNHANRLVPKLLGAQPDARAVLMTNSVAPFLQSVRKRGLMGHRWGRRLYLELQNYTGVDLGMSPEEQFSMTDLQAAGLAWLLSQYYFTRLATGDFKDRVRTLDGDFFNENRGETIRAVLAFGGVDLGEHTAEVLGANPAFTNHSKLGGPMVETTADKPTSEEIEQVEHWLGLIAGQMDVDMPLRQTLL
ncbi:hypothetical protein GRI69_02665 [Erythrobacter vulgaris]|uniref:Sulfotransferase n=1 Tax=Qipengyuania vulgaris TaxID=291985 RepID=A0A844XNY1_9SPHN|nr:hypothetical protein [Qipengyuania vulgaris]MXO47166.1 hypothetical protein [Qipengyuania vulgaris]